MMLDDIEDVLVVERDAFQMPWIRQAFMNELMKNPFAYYLVAANQEQIVGYCGIWIALYEAHITNIAVLSSHRHQGVGRLLLQGMIRRALELEAISMTLEVRESNTDAQSFYKTFGFKKSGVKKGYYTDNCEDAWIMRLAFS
ncbi:ribosomal protein S18-alanine N-acetyltransferase [Salicibibacter cibarius]|uniref:[Ribosomal protein bS18]-alanine N-acetyltransferase n=2 Tax=Salicibibacter cibarius TaxID=2743000 RepID=A0A7T6Z7I0_9BACI|nr:ribosomal protein S18-alanine N-acetyltransferase [Salicibibacter cibarius]